MKRKLEHQVVDCHNNRIIAHIDLDCFYVQVERSINPNLKNLPVVVVQYNPFGNLTSLSPTDNRVVNSGSLIAVSYEAREKGVKRFMRGSEAKQVCSDVILVQVPTSHGKADLKIYRDSSSRIVSILSKRFKCIIERASIDEVYLDLTDEANKLFEESQENNDFYTMAISHLKTISSRIAGEDFDEIKMSKNQIRDGHTGTTSSKDNHNSWFDKPLESWSDEDKLMLCGSMLVAQLRKDVLDELGFTCSAGIAHNKKLAKLASAMHKPNKQTLVPTSIVHLLLRTIPFNRIQGFGGKLGNSVNEIFGDKVNTLADLLVVDRDILVDKFGEDTTKWIIDIAHGIDNEPVQDRSLTKSIGCGKSFRSTNKLTKSNLMDGVVLHWLTELATELIERVEQDHYQHLRYPKQLHVGASISVSTKSKSMHGTTNSSNNIDRVAQWHNEQGFDLSKITGFPALGIKPDNLSKTSLSSLMRAIGESSRISSISPEQQWHITYLSLSATSFSSQEVGTKAISTYFSNSPSQTINISTSKLFDSNWLTNSKFVNQTSSSKTEQKLSAIKLFFKPTAIIDPNNRIALINSTEVNQLDENKEDDAIELSPQQHFNFSNLTENISSLESNVNADDVISQCKNDNNNTVSNTVNNNINEMQGIDEEVFHALPLDIQLEIIKSLRSGGSDNNYNINSGYENNFSSKDSKLFPIFSDSK
eukprot:gene14724-19791_t